MLISINDFFINSENVESLLSAIRQPRCIKLSVQSPIRYLKAKGVDKLEELERADKSVQAVSKNIDIVKGDRIKEPAQNFDIPHSLMILTLPEDDKAHDKKSKQEVLSLIIRIIKQLKHFSLFED